MSVQALVPAHAGLWPFLLRSLDRPAHQALELARRPLAATLAPAALGLFLVSVSTAVAALLGPTPGAGLARLDVLRAALEAWAVVVPGAVIIATALRIGLSPRALLGAAALGILAGGVASASLVPLMAFLALVARGLPGVLKLLVLLVPVVSLASTCTVFQRVVNAVDDSTAARWLGRGFVAALLAVFLLRSSSILHGLLS